MNTINVFVIEDDVSDHRQIQDYCSEAQRELGVPIQPVLMRSLKDFEEQIKHHEPHVMVVDLKLGDSSDDRSGWKSVRRVLEREIIPVIVYSAFAREEPDETFKNVIIRRIVKGEGEQFGKILKIFIKMKMAFIKEKERIESEFGYLTLETIGKILGEDEIEEIDENVLVNLATGRLVSYLMNIPPGEEKKFLPESIYVYPPIEVVSKNCLFLGDFLEANEANGETSIWLVVSPSCDLIFEETRKPKINDVLLLRCYRKYSEIHFLKDDANEESRKDKIRTRFERKTVKILKSPAQIFRCRYLLVSLKDYMTIPYEKIIEGIQRGTWKKIAALSVPYAESLKNLYIADLSRIGTPSTSSIDEERKWAEDFAKG